MAKYDWIALEKEFILSDYKSVSAFLKDKGISINGSTKKSTKGWKNKKVLKEDKKSTKTIEKIIEKQSTDELLKKVMEATGQLNIHMDMFGKQHKGIVDRSDIKKLTSALKDLKDIIPQKQEEEEDNSFIEALNGKTEGIWNEKE